MDQTIRLEPSSAPRVRGHLGQSTVALGKLGAEQQTGSALAVPSPLSLRQTPQQRRQWSTRDCFMDQRRLTRVTRDLFLVNTTGITIRS